MLVPSNILPFACAALVGLWCAPALVGDARGDEVAPGSVQAGAASTNIDFARDIRPILAAHCLECHGAQKQEGRLRLDIEQRTLEGGFSGPAIVPSDAEASLIVRRILGSGDEDRMPLDREPLSDEQISIIRKWIDAGATWPDSDTPIEQPRHWAYVAPERPTPPPVQQAEWVRNSIDPFVLAEIERNGLSPAPEAERERLIRRVTLDLIGLPPTLAEIDAFLADDDPSAYQRVVDRLLASPRYGERWATPWLDAARYADSNGYQRDGRRAAWGYRDWVVAALNTDLPFDQFTIEQVAGDLLPEPTFQQRVATGFHRNTMANVEAGVHPDEQYTLAVIDRVNTTGTVWLGTTIECAQCHNHKYDPFSQREYYQLYAFFNNTEPEIEEYALGRVEFAGPRMALPLDEQTRAERDRMRADLQRLQDQHAQLTKAIEARQPRWEAQQAETGYAGVSADIAAILQQKPEERSPEARKTLKRFFRGRSTSLSDLQTRVEEAEQEFDGSEPSTPVMQELAERRTTHIFVRGNFLAPGTAVEPGLPAALHPLPKGPAADRLALARWLVDEQNPLVARVTVNRHWLEFFGRGLVTTPEDFGTRGAPPTHPQLLDWLATEFIRQGWSVKALHRLIVTSATYRQSSHLTPELRERDPDNALYARGPRRRLAAESIRDNALACSGLLSGKMFGPPVFPHQPPGVWHHTGVVSNEWNTSSGADFYRRGLYVYWRRTVPYPSFVNFDAPRREVCTVARGQSNTPLQALTLMNDFVYVDAANGLAQRLLTEPPAGATIEERVAHGFRLVTGRRASATELAIATEYLNEELTQFAADKRGRARALARLSRRPLPDGVDEPAMAAWISVGNLLLNLDETITKE